MCSGTEPSGHHPGGAKHSLISSVMLLPVKLPGTVATVATVVVGGVTMLILRGFLLKPRIETAHHEHIPLSPAPFRERDVAIPRTQF